MTWLLQQYLSFRSRVRLHFFDAALKRRNKRHARWLRSMRKQVLPAPAGANPHWACGGTDEVRQMQRLRTR